MNEVIPQEIIEKKDLFNKGAESHAGCSPCRTLRGYDQEAQ